MHSGFLRNWQQVWGDVEKELLQWWQGARERTNKSTANPDIYITGHSLGGAMAVLAGLHLHDKQDEMMLWSAVKGIYTYGQPMVVDNQDRDLCQRRIGDRLYRHVYWNDLIPHLPPLSVGAFDHFGFEIKFVNSKWKLRQGSIDNAFIRPRTTQVVSVLAAAPFAAADFVVRNVQWLSLWKMPWSLHDHNPYFYWTSFEMEPLQPQEHSCVVS